MKESIENIRLMMEEGGSFELAKILEIHRIKSVLGTLDFIVKEQFLLTNKGERVIEATIKQYSEVLNKLSDENFKI